MVGHSYATDVQSEAAELAKAILSAASSQQIATVCAGVEHFLQKHTADQARWFFSITFPTLICKIFGFDDSASSSTKPQSPNGWIDTATLSGGSELSDKIFSLLSPNGVLLSSISAVDKHCLVKYVFPNERLPEWIRLMLLNERDCRALADLCPLLNNRVKEDPAKGSPCQVQLNVFEYYMFWFAYCAICRGNTEGSEEVKVQKVNMFRFENWAYSIPGLSSGKRGTEQKNEGNLYIRLLYAYLCTFVPIYESNALQPYRSSLLHHSWGYDNSIIERAEFLVNVVIQFWLVDNDFSPLPLSVCKSYGLLFPFRSVLGETPPTSGLGEVIDVFVKYLTLSSVLLVGGYDKVESAGSPFRKIPGSLDVVKPRDVSLDLQSIDSWTSLIRRPLYRFILRTFLFCPVETSLKNVSQVFNVWVNYMEPWKISLEEFTEFDATINMPCKDRWKEVIQTSSHGYSSSWQWFVLANYLYYSSLVMHFIGFAHKFLHTNPEVIVQMVSKVISILASSTELINLIKNVDTVFHLKSAGSSKSLLNSLYRFIPTVREELQDWENGLCESNADGSFLHENWNKDLRLFSESEDGGQQLLQLFVLRAESELQAIAGDNIAQSLQCLDSLKTQLSNLYSGSILKSTSSVAEPVHSRLTRDEVFCPRSFGNNGGTNVKHKGDWMKQHISSGEIAWLAKLLVNLSDWLNENLGLNQVEDGHAGSSWCYVDMSSDAGKVCGPSDAMKMLFYSMVKWLIVLGGAGMKFMRKHGMRVNLRALASKKVVGVLLICLAFCISKRLIA